jgi:hypothetical protein
MVVVDASVLVDALLLDGAARARLAEANLQVPELIDAELLSVLRRLVLAGRLPEQHALQALAASQRLGYVATPVAISGRVPGSCAPTSAPTTRSTWPWPNSWAPPCSPPTPVQPGLPACAAPWRC